MMTTTNNERKKTVWTLNIGNYLPELCKITYPLFEQYAKKIGADFRVITEKKFMNSGYDFVYEKLQIYELGKDNDWNIFFDADTMVNPDFIDVTEFIPDDHCFHFAKDFANMRWKYDDYFRRDGRNIGTCGWFVVSSKLTHDLWKPSEQTPEEMHKMIFPTANERNVINLGLGHFEDDYTVSRNIARYGLKHIIYADIKDHYKVPDVPLWHDYRLSGKDKIIMAKKIASDWSV